MARKLTVRVGLGDASANHQGFTIRVAVIQSPQDLGSIPELLGKPRTYARFLGAELLFAYRGRLLVVMRTGYGYSQRGGKPIPGAAAQLAPIPLPAGGTPNQLIAAADVAVPRLAAGAGHTLPASIALPSTGTPTAAANSSTSFLTRSKFKIAAVLIVALGVLVAGVTVWVTYRRSPDG